MKQEENAVTVQINIVFYIIYSVPSLSLTQSVFHSSRFHTIVFSSFFCMLRIRVITERVMRVMLYAYSNICVVF